LFWDAKAKKVRGINGSGRAPKALNLELLRSQGVQGDEVSSIGQWSLRVELSLQIPLNNLNSVTVPCAAAGWIKTVEEFGSGKLTMAEILEPAIRMAREGVPVHEITSDAVSGLPSKVELRLTVSVAGRRGIVEASFAELRRVSSHPS
jgi:gamma-glutamyltranspeptidase/glutathione hydrolase